MYSFVRETEKHFENYEDEGKAGYWDFGVFSSLPPSYITAATTVILPFQLPFPQDWNEADIVHLLQCL